MLDTASHCTTILGSSVLLVIIYSLPVAKLQTCSYYDHLASKDTYWYNQAWPHALSGCDRMVD